MPQAQLTEPDLTKLESQEERYSSLTTGNLTARSFWVGPVIEDGIDNYDFSSNAIGIGKITTAATFAVLKNLPPHIEIIAIFADTNVAAIEIIPESVGSIIIMEDVSDPELIAHLPLHILNVMIENTCKPQVLQELAVFFSEIHITKNMSPETAAAIPPHIDTVVIHGGVGNDMLWQAFPDTIKNIELTTPISLEDAFWIMANYRYRSNWPSVKYNGNYLIHASNLIAPLNLLFLHSRQDFYLTADPIRHREIIFANANFNYKKTFLQQLQIIENPEGSEKHKRLKLR